MTPTLVLRCSNLARIMQCRGVLSLVNLLDDTSGAPAEEGTAAGELLQAMLEQKTLTPTVATCAKNGVQFDEDMYFHLRPIAEDILVRSHGTALCETRIDWASRSPGIVIRGQYDIAFSNVIDRVLHVEDLKYGYGIIPAKKNWQLIGYAIGEIIRLASLGVQAPAFIEFRIHQPRPWIEESAREPWRISYQELMGYYEEIEAQLALIARGDRTLATGDKCKYCPAAQCPAMNRAIYNGVDVVLSDFKEDSMDEAAIGKQYALLTRIAELVKIKTDSMNQLAVSRVRSGKVIPGYSLEDSYGHRKWKGNVTGQGLSILAGGIEVMEKPTLMSPSKAEKAGVPKALIAGLTTQPFIGAKLVPKDSTTEAEKAFGKL